MLSATNVGTVDVPAQQGYSFSGNEQRAGGFQALNDDSQAGPFGYGDSSNNTTLKDISLTLD